MNPAHREGWPSSQASAPGQTPQQQAEQSQRQSARPLDSYGYVESACLIVAPDVSDQAAIKHSCTSHVMDMDTDKYCGSRPNNPNAQAPPHASPAQAPGPVLPPPSGTPLVDREVTNTADLDLGTPFYSSNAAATHNQNLPPLPGLTNQPPHSSPHQSAQRAPSTEAGSAAQGHSISQGPPYSLPGISQTLQQQGPPQDQASADRERELRERETREREMMESHAAQHAAQQEEQAKREAEQRDRELHERQQREQAALQSHSAPIQIHQPVAVAPSTRTVHGPNGLLGQSGPLVGANPLAGQMGGPNAGGPLYANAPAQHDQTTPRMQHAVQAPTQAQMLMPLTGPPGAMGMGQGQQPILNVGVTRACLFRTPLKLI